MSSAKGKFKGKVKGKVKGKIKGKLKGKVKGFSILKKKFSKCNSRITEIIFELWSHRVSLNSSLRS